MPTKRIAINGFGRIGRLALRTLLTKGGKDIEVVAVNDLTDNETLAHLFKYDTAQGTFNGKVSADKNYLYIKNKKIRAYTERNPLDLKWKSQKVDVVLECTGVFRDKEKAAMHLTAGAKKVLISAPGKGGVQTYVTGINDKDLDPNETIFSNASCTTNCLAPMVKVLDENFGIVRGAFTTVHAYTADQRIQDAPHKDLRRARACAQNIVPTSTGAASAVSKVYPAVEGKLTGIAARVPVITGSLTDLTVELEKTPTDKEVNAAFAKAARSRALKRVLEYSEEPLVSTDIIGNTHSCIFDSGMTIAIGNMVKVIGWYDNEAGYAARLAEMAIRLAKM